MAGSWGCRWPLPFSFWRSLDSSSSKVRAIAKSSAGAMLPLPTWNTLFRADRSGAFPSVSDSDPSRTHSVSVYWRLAIRRDPPQARALRGIATGSSTKWCLSRVSMPSLVCSRAESTGGEKPLFGDAAASASARPRSASKASSLGAKTVRKLPLFPWMPSFVERSWRLRLPPASNSPSVPSAWER
ncbi:unnamed protein product [Pseudo-nitzschia multistriata]|uniref:Uncharacterized protein n=1 Tax=Pseudo-nitzschia multistriata TaxID=183589 RepID=A0A448ZDY7_9STRA|nr:unnamed protein product [Pseudo-nitzschia multistriata]